MADDVQTPVAESSPAAEVKPHSVVPDKTEQISVPKDPEAYAEWRLTGKLPDKPSSDKSAPSKKSADSTESGKGAPDSDSGDKRQAKTRNAETRKEELDQDLEKLRKNREIREKLAERDKLRREEAEYQTKSGVKAESPTGPQGLKRPEKPKQENFDTWDQYETAKDKYDEDLADWKAAQRIEQYEQQKRQETAAREMQGRLDEAKARYGEDAEPKIVATAKTVFDDQEVAPAIKAAVTRSQYLVDALYVLGSDENDLSEFLHLAKKDPLEALRKWFTVEALVKSELGKNGSHSSDESPETPRGTDGKFKPVKPIREAPAPRTELGGTGSPAGDERVRAVTQGDFRSFKAAADARDLQRMRGR